MRKFKLFINYDKEEKWLNEISPKGYELIDISFGYKFRSIKPENATIRIDYRTFKKQEDFIDYCTLFEDSGWKHIAGKKYSGAQYFKKIDENSEEDIFSDNLSKAGKYKRLSNRWLTLALSSLPIALSISNKHIDVNAMLNPKLLYYTPGLWKMKGIRFGIRFLFETPFAILRGYIWLVIPIMVFLYFCFSIKAKILYYKEKNS